LAGQQEKTEKATPKRMQDARKKGQVAKSTDLSAAILLFGMVLFLYATRLTFLGNLARYLAGYFSEVGSLAIEGASPVVLLTGTVADIAGLITPFLLAAAVLAVAVNLIQVGFIFNPEGLRPKFTKLNPLEGIKRLFSSRGLMEAGKSLLKVIILGLVAYLTIRGQFGQILDTLREDPVVGFNTVANLVWRIFLYGSLAYLALAVADFRYQRYMMDKSLKMTRQEVKEEMRSTEGDPVIRGKQRARRRQFMLNLIRKNVPKATVVVTNPTHLAVALSYQVGGKGAPRVVAKGAGELARRIRAVARESGVPVVENLAVARFLYRNVDVGAEIPGQLYQAVAQILAYVYRTQKAG
jgi:flagellar biosynthetic protein FlhB